MFIFIAQLANILSASVQIDIVLGQSVKLLAQNFPSLRALRPLLVPVSDLLLASARRFFVLLGRFLRAFRLLLELLHN